MKEWLKQNWKPASTVLALIVMYLLAKFAPMAEAERELALAICQALDLVAVGAIPKFALVHKE